MRQKLRPAHTASASRATRAHAPTRDRPDAAVCVKTERYHKARK